MNAGPVILAPSGTLAAHLAQAENWYEAAQESPSRMLIWHPVQNARKDLDRYTRQQLVRKARYLYKNSPFIRGLIERIVTLTIGSGFQPVFKSSNPSWNERAKKVWMARSRSIQLGPRLSFSQYQRCVFRARLIDGEAFSLKTFDEIGTQLLQGLEADMICGSQSSTKDREAGAVDGFNLSANGTVLSYNVKSLKAPYSAESIIHHFTPNRLGQYRGETILASAINTAIDIDDILALEKDAVKDASGKQDVIKTATGQLDAESFRNARFGNLEGAGAFNLPPSENSKDDYYRTRFGGSPVVLKRGDEYTPYKPDRPGSAWTGFMAFLANTICTSTLFPPSVLLPVNIGGTDVRRDLDIAQRVVEPWQLDMVAELDAALDYLIEQETLDGGELEKDLPDDYRSRTWHFPQKINVDRGQAQQDREDVARGLMSREEYHARYADDALEVDATIIEEAKRRKQAIMESGFKDVQEFVQVLSLNPQVLMQQQPQQGQPQPTE